MDIKTAISIIEDLADNFGESFFDTLVYMGANLDDFTEQDVVAYRVFMREGARMFAPA